MKCICASAAIVLLITCGASAWENQQGPIKPPPGKAIKRIPVEGTPEPPPLPVEEMLRRITERENEIIRARNASTYQVALRLQEFDDAGDTVGEFQMAKDILFTPEGKPYEKVVRTSRSTLTQLALPSEELSEFAGIRPFMLPTVSLEFYELTYAGKQPLDELSTFMFRVRPRRLSRTHLYFEGVIWVEDRDFAIVKTYGKWVSEVEQKTGFEPFNFFESIRENVKGTIWFPAFVRSEETLKPESGAARIRLTLRFTDYKTGVAPALAPPPK